MRTRALLLTLTVAGYIGSAQTSSAVSIKAVTLNPAATVESPIVKVACTYVRVCPTPTTCKLVPYCFSGG